MNTAWTFFSPWPKKIRHYTYIHIAALTGNFPSDDLPTNKWCLFMTDHSRWRKRPVNDIRSVGRKKFVLFFSASARLPVRVRLYSWKKKEEKEPIHTHTHIICFIFSSKRRYKTNDENNGGCLKYLRRAESQLTFLSDSYHRIYIYRICSRVGLARNVTWLAPVPQAHPTEGKIHTQ